MHVSTVQLLLTLTCATSGRAPKPLDNGYAEPPLSLSRVLPPAQYQKEPLYFPSCTSIPLFDAPRPAPLISPERLTTHNSPTPTPHETAPQTPTPPKAFITCSYTVKTIPPERTSRARRGVACVFRRGRGGQRAPRRSEGQRRREGSRWSTGRERSREMEEGSRRKGTTYPSPKLGHPFLAKDPRRAMEGVPVRGARFEGLHSSFDDTVRREGGGGRGVSVHPEDRGREEGGGERGESKRTRVAWSYRR